MFINIYLLNLLTLKKNQKIKLDKFLYWEFFNISQFI